MSEQTAIKDFVIRGPRTAAWVMRFLCENGGTPLARHTRFRADARLSATDPGVALHETMRKMLQVATTYDQQDCTNLGVVELICREIQMLEEKHTEKLTSRGAGLTEESHLFTGTTIVQGNVCMCPALKEFIANQLKDEAAILKERRKAREERQLHRPPPTGGGGGGGGGGKKGKKDGKREEEGT